MTNYQLAKIVQWAGTVPSRKHIQKVCFLLQAAGCPLDLDFILHQPGVYSEELAQRLDQLTERGILNERTGKH